MSQDTGIRRIVSIDQFRGYAVLAMFVVNYCGYLKIAPAFLKHHNTYFSYADSIMPAFIFAVGISFRLTVLRELAKPDSSSWRRRYLKRSLALVCTSVIIYGLGSSFSSWSEIDWNSFGYFVAKFLKADLWEVLAIIGVTQMLVLPWISRSLGVRVIVLIACLVLHAVLSYGFNFAFVQGRPNILDQWLGTTGARAWDGGFWGVISWCVPMLAGSIAYDVVRKDFAPPRQISLLLMIGLGLAGLGYSLSCLTTLYPVDRQASSRPFADSPVIPALQDAGDTTVGLAEPPFFPPPEGRPWNYWMMSKRIVSAPFVLFGSGFCFLTYACFVLICDRWNRSWSVFATFGRNPLLAYVIHHWVLVAMMPLFPADSPWPYALLGFVIFLGITFLSVRHFEKQNVFIRL